MIRNRFIESFSACLCFVALFATRQSHASFSVDPGAKTIWVEKGKTREMVYVITNDDSEAVTITPSVKDMFILPENKGISVATWLEPLDKKVTVPAKGSQKIRFKVKVPKQASGELASFIAFTPEAVEDSKSEFRSFVSTNTMSMKIRTLITLGLYVQIKGTERGEADLGAVSVSNRFPVTATDAGSIDLSVAVKNSGNVHLSPYGRFEIQKKDTSTVLHQVDIQRGWPVMPYSSQVYTASAIGNLPAGEYVVVSSVTISGVNLQKKTAFAVENKGIPTGFHDIQ